MCGTATKSDANPMSTAKTKKSQSARAEANRRNAKKVTGPRTEGRKSKSRSNALKHGMTGQTVILPGDDGQAFANRLQYLQDDLQPRSGSSDSL